MRVEQQPAEVVAVHAAHPARMPTTMVNRHDHRRVRRTGSLRPMTITVREATPDEYASRRPGHRGGLSRVRATGWRLGGLPRDDRRRRRARRPHHDPGRASTRTHGSSAAPPWSSPTRVEPEDDPALDPGGSAHPHGGRRARRTPARDRTGPHGRLHGPRASATARRFVTLHTTASHDGRPAHVRVAGVRPWSPTGAFPDGFVLLSYRLELAGQRAAYDHPGPAAGAHDLAAGQDHAVLALGLHQPATELLLVQLRVEPAARQEFVVRALLHDPSAVDHEDDVGLAGSWRAGARSRSWCDPP